MFSITGNMDVTKNLLILSEIENASVNTGGVIAKGGMGIQKNLNVGGNLNVGYDHYMYSSGPASTIKIGINTNTPRCTLDINTNDLLICRQKHKIHHH